MKECAIPWSSPRHPPHSYRLIFLSLLASQISRNGARQCSIGLIVATTKRSSRRVTTLKFAKVSHQNSINSDLLPTTLHYNVTTFTGLVDERQDHRISRWLHPRGFCPSPPISAFPRSHHQARFSWPTDLTTSTLIMKNTYGMN